MNKIEKTVVDTAVKYGFTFTGDSIFKSYLQAKRAINSLVKSGYLYEEKDHDGCVSYAPTEKARNLVKYGIKA